jgi:predicted RNA-binding protein
MPKYYIICASRDHIQIGIAGGFMQANHGKKTKLKRLKKGDWIFCYSSKNSFTDKLSTCQKFTAAGVVRDEDLYQGVMAEGFEPWRRNVDFIENITEVDIKTLLFDLHFVKDVKRWGFPLMYGFLEIDESDDELIKSKMLELTK